MNRQKDTHPRNIASRLGICLSLFVGTLLFVTAVFGQLVEEPAAELRARIDALIADLGADEYQVREAAEYELSEMGLTAYESLLELRNNKDIEVRLRSRHIVDSLRGRFLVSGVDEQAVVWLKQYSSFDEAERLDRIDSLSKLLPEAGSDALARVARFEADEQLSQAAALAILSLPILPDETRPELARAITAGVGFSERTAARWLRNYAAACQAEDGTLKVWQQLIEEEKTRNLSLDESEEVRKSNCQVLRKVALDDARSKNQTELATKLTAEIIEQFDSDRDYEEWLRWLQARDEWNAIVKFSESHPQLFTTEPWFVYGLAEAQKQLGELDESKRLAKLALEHESSDAGDHFALGFQLKGERGQFEWAEAEYRACIGASTPIHVDYYSGVVWLGELLHDLQRDEEAADLMQSVVDDTELPKEYRKDREKIKIYQSKVRAMHETRSLVEMRSKAAHFRSCHFRAIGNREEELAALEEGIKYSSSDVDILIAMFTVKDPTDSWKEMTSEKIRTVNTDYRDQIKKTLGTYEQLRNRRELRESTEEVLAQLLNQYAWLVGNTEGDIDEAIRNSHKSLEFSPGSPGYLDTLGRCYYRAGRFEEAKRYQQMAVDRAPHELQIQRQLTLIEDALESADGEPVQAPAARETERNLEVGGVEKLNETVEPAPSESDALSTEGTQR